MTTDPQENEEGEEGEAPGGIRSLLSWRVLFRLMLSPMAFLAPCFSCGAAISFAHAIGPVGAVLGGLGGFVLGVGAIYLWYFVITGHPFQSREEEFAERMIADAEAGKLRPRLHPAKSDIDAIPLTSGPDLAIDISGEIEEALRRVDAHEDAAEALAAAEVLAEKNPRDARAASLLARVLLRAGRPKEGVRVAGEALHVAVLRDQMVVVGRLVNAFWAQREELALDPSIARAVADHLETEGQPDRAAFFRSGRTSLV